MSHQRKVLALFVAVVLMSAAYAPRVAWSVSLSDAQQQEAARVFAMDDAPAPKRKGSGFGRALGAPFRALAKLFGGGKKARKEEAKKTKTAPPVAGTATEPPASAVVTRKEEGLEERKGNKDRKRASSERAGAMTPTPAPAPVPAPPAPVETTKIVRPSEARPAPPAGLWIPVIEGIPKDPLSQGRALLQHGYLNEAVAELSIATLNSPNLVEANNLLGLAYDRLGLHRTAIEAYERALSVAPKDAIVIANLGNSLYFDGKYEAALKRLKQAARLSPGAPAIHNNLGVVQAQLHKYDDAFKSFARASGQHDAHVTLARVLEAARRDKDAARHYEAALRLQPGATALLERLVVIYERNGERTKADTARRNLGAPKNEQKTTTGGGG